MNLSRHRNPFVHSQYFGQETHTELHAWWKSSCNQDDFKYEPVPISSWNTGLPDLDLEIMWFLCIFCAAKSHQANPLLHTHMCMHADSGSSMLQLSLRGASERSLNSRVQFLVLDNIFYPCLMSSRFPQIFASIRQGCCDLGKTEDARAESKREHIKRPVMSSVLEDGKQCVKISHSHLIIWLKKMWVLKWHCLPPSQWLSQCESVGFRAWTTSP